MNAPERIAVALAADVDATAFGRHYAACRNERKQQWLQRLFTVWHFYLEPLGLGFFPGKLFCDIHFGTNAGFALALLCGGITCLLIGPLWIRIRLRSNPHKRSYIYYVAAIERCIG